MSYGVQILSGELPSTYEEAEVLRDAIEEAEEGQLETGEPSAPMVELHRRLTARHPCICDDDSGPWSDGPLINDFGTNIATLGLSFSRVEEVLPFLIKTSTDMGFWVLDPQDEVVHLPGGMVRRPRTLRPDRRWWQFWK